MPPAVDSRDARGKVTLRAVRLDRPLQIDGRLDEAVYRDTLPIDRFEQQVPREGQPATEKTQAWILFDDTNLYFCARMLDSQPERIVANEMRHDSVNIFNGGDSMTLVLDTFHDRRNGVLFQTNPLGGMREQAIADGQYIESWNTVWNVRSARFEGGWSAEMVIPFKSLRFRDAGTQIWGINFRRVIRWKNEYSGVTPMPAAFGGSGLAQMQMAATLVGLEIPSRTRNLELKPYALGSTTTDLTAATPFRNDATGDAGLDVKYGLSRGLTADLTLNTDFAQVEEDLQQVNLTRFNLLFPEKRDFFLEGQGIFAFGGRSLSGRGSGGDSDDVPIMFFSRQIGLANGRTVPVLGGGRVTGKAGAYDIAALNIETARSVTAGVDPTNFTAVRVRRDILRRSNVGVIATARNPASGGSTSLLAGADASFRLSQNNTLLGYYTRTDRVGAAGQAESYRARFDYAGDRYGIGVEHLLVGAGFAPEVGYARREDFRRNTGTVRFSPRLRRSRTVRQLTWQGTYTYDTDADVTEVQNRSIDGSFRAEFHSGDTATFQYVGEYELLPANFRIARGVTVPQGGYDNRTVTASYSLANNRAVAGRFTVSTGALYDGTRHEASYSGRIAVRPQFALEPSLSLAWVRLPYGDFNARLIANRFTYTPTTRLFVSSLVQFNVDAKTLSSSIRMRWEYLPGSELFIVYSDGRDTARPGTALQNRTFAVKATRLLRF
ncbi:MAG: DUF5916 domain-containing protein [Vicinamibacterales bacterium]